MPFAKKFISAAAILLATTTLSWADELNVFLSPSPSSTAIQSFIPAFEKATGHHVNVTEVPYGEMHQKLMLAVQLKQGQYDVAQFDNSFLTPFGAAGTMMPLDDKIAASKEYDISDFGKGQQDYGKYKGQTLGLTLSTEPFIQWYRADIYDALGLKPATTWDEFKANAKAVKESGKGDGMIFGYGPNVSWWWMTMVWSFGGKLYDENYNPTVNTPEAIAGTQFLKDMLAYAPEGALSASSDDATIKFLSTDIGAMVQYSGYWGMLSDPANQKHAGKIGTAPMPKGAADVTHLAGWNIGIPSDAKNPEMAWQFMEFVLGKSNAKNYLNAGAAAIGRKSIITDPELVAKYSYLPVLDIPEGTRIERYPQIRVWPEFEKAALDALAGIMNGSVEVKAGLDALQETEKPILAQENAK
jgi:multiple sugar transport system substrate-binding protein